MTTYHSVAFVSQMTAMAIFGTVLAGAVIYAFWPGNRARFEAASRLPLAADDAPTTNAERARTEGDRNGH